MRNQAEMFTALLDGETLVSTSPNSANEYILSKDDGRIYYRNKHANEKFMLCNGIPTFDKVMVKPKIVTVKLDTVTLKYVIQVLRLAIDNSCYPSLDCKRCVTAAISLLEQANG